MLAISQQHGVILSGIDVFRPGGNGAALVPVEIVEGLLVRPLLVLPVLLCLLIMDQWR